MTAANDPTLAPSARAPARKSPRQGFLAKLLRHRGGLFGLTVFGFFFLLAILGRFIAPYEANASDFTSLLAQPSSVHWFGTDELGRDTLSRVIAGSGIAVAVAALSVAIAMAVGVLIGVVAGYFGGLVDTVLNRSQDVLFAFPTLLLAIIIVAVLGPGLFNAVLAIAIVYTPRFARIARASALSVRSSEYIDAARLAGVGTSVILVRHVLPNVLPPVIVLAALSMSTAQLAYARELASDIAQRYSVQRLLAESLHYRPLEHGEHHERYLIPLPAEARALMALCFCSHCRAAATQAGVAVERLTAAVQMALQPVWEGSITLPHDQPMLPDWARDELTRYIDVRTATVTSLIAEVRDAVAANGVSLTFIDHGGTMAHVMHGTAADDEVTLSSRKLGIDPASAAAASDAYGVLAYVDTRVRLEAMLASYRRVLGVDARLEVAMRPLLPDCQTEVNLAGKVDAVRAAGVEAIDFYHYAMMPLNRLDWIHGALSART